METEFNLSEKKILDFLKSSPVKKYYAYPEEDVKKFIKRLKDVYKMADEDIKENLYKWIDKLAGEKLVEGKGE